MYRTGTLLLAAGISSRMGKENKLLLPINGEPIIRKTVKNFLNISNAGIWVVVGYDNKRIIEALEGIKVNFIMNKEFNLGQMSSVHKGLENLPFLDNLIIGLGDQPFIKDKHLNSILTDHKKKSEKASITIPIKKTSINKTLIRGNPIILKNEIIDEIKKDKKNFGCKGYIKKNPKLVHFFETDIDSFFMDIDTPDVYKKIINDNYI